MPNYYEILKIAPTATEAEIRQAYDDLNAQWRRLVTHHDPQIADQANQSLRQLEQIQTTLLNLTARQAYDAGIGLGGAMGGLADPSAFLQSRAPIGAPVPAAPRSAAPTATQAPVAAPSSTLWACYKCNAENQPYTTYCLKCGAQLVRECPECEKNTSLVATGRCSTCGYHYDVATKRKELKSELTVVEREVESLDLYKKGLLSAVKVLDWRLVLITGLIITSIVSWYFGLIPSILVVIVIVAWYRERNTNNRAAQAKAQEFQTQIDQFNSRIQGIRQEIDSLLPEGRK